MPWPSLMSYGGFFDFLSIEKELEDIRQQLGDVAVWQNTEKTKQYSQRQKLLLEQLAPYEKGDAWLADIGAVFELYQEMSDESLLVELNDEVRKFSRWVEALSFEKMFSGEHDNRSCFVEIQSGSGGTEAQDWAMMLMRMYIRYCDRKGFKVEIAEEQQGEVAGIKSVTFSVTGQMAYGWLKTESGVHRLVRKSPFDSGNRRHTSFASVFIYPEIDDTIDIQINPADLRTDTYRASGAGGQHVNTTESAIRITHIPTGLVVTCQSGRSQHQNRAYALKQLASRLYQLERDQQLQAKAQLDASKDNITWGSQIRSYVLDKSKIKDLRSGYESSNTQGVLDGDLEEFIVATLKSNCGDQ